MPSGGWGLMTMLMRLCNEFVSMADTMQLWVLGVRIKGRQEAGNPIRQRLKSGGKAANTGTMNTTDGYLAASRLSSSTMNTSGKSSARSEKPDSEVSPSFGKTWPLAGELTRYAGHL